MAEVGSAQVELEKRYAHLVSQNLAGMYRTTVHGEVLDCNQALARMLGYAQPQDVMEVGAKALYLEAGDREGFLATLREAGGQLLNHEITLRHRKGRPVHMLENVGLRVDEQGREVIEGILIDITALKQTELEQQRLLASYRQLLEHMRDGILIVQDGLVRYANPAAEQILGGVEHGEAWMRTFHPDDRDKVRELNDVLDREQGMGPVSLRVSDGQGGWTDLVAHAVAMHHQGAPAAQITLQDVAVQERFLHERARLRMVEEINQVLRQEINEHRKTQDELRRSRRFFRALVDSSLDMIMASDPEGCIVQFNPAACARFGYAEEEVMGLGSPMLYADAEDYTKVQIALAQQGAFSGEIHNVDKQGQEFISYLSASKIHDEDGRYLGVMGVSRDITEARKDRVALEASEQRYRDLFENATDLIHSMDLDGRIAFVNEAWAATLGFAPLQAAGMRIQDVLDPEHARTFLEVVQRAVAQRSVERLRTAFVAADGRRVWLEGSINAKGAPDSPVNVRVILNDITHEMAAQAKVREHEAKLRALFESGDHMFWTVDRAIRLTSFNQGYTRMVKRLHGTEPQLVAGEDSPRKLFADPEYHRFWEQKYAMAFAGEQVRFETDLRDKQGRRVCNEIFLSPVFAADGSVKEVFGIGHEITEQKIAEELVREQAARLQAIFESSANMMFWTLDEDFRITAFNSHFSDSIREHLGITFQRGDDFIQRMLPSVAGGRIKGIQARYKAALQGEAQQFEVELTATDGASLWVETFLNPIVVEGAVKEISCLAYGITDKKEAQRRLLESLYEKEVLLKEVHHRVKNNLQVISSILNLQTSYVGGDAAMIDLLRESQHRIRSMSYIHETLYRTKDLSSLDLGEYMGDLARSLVMSYRLNERVGLEADVESVRLGIDQAIPCGLILNEIIGNALKHAFAGDGGGTVHLHLRCKGERVEITVWDDGRGLPDGFDDEQHGGLGLQLVHTLIGQLDGKLERSSGPGVRYFITFERNNPTA